MKISQSERIKAIFSFIFLKIFKNLLGIIRNKVIAVVHGVAQVGLLGQFITFNNFQSQLVVFGISASLINSYNTSEAKGWSKDKVLALNFLIILITNIINSFVVFFFLRYLTILVYQDINYEILIALSVLINLLFSVSLFMELTVQAEKQFKLLYRGRIFALIIAIITIFPLTYFYGITGAVYNLLILYVASLIYFAYYTGFFKYIKVLLNPKNVFTIKKQYIIFVLKVALIDVGRAGIVLGSLFMVRLIILHTFDIKLSGFYQAIVSLSNYINVIAEGFVIYYFPIISSAQNERSIEDEINTNFEFLIYLILPIVIAIILFSKLILHLLFSSDFIFLSPNLELLMISKVLYTFYYFYSINLLGRNFLKKFISIEAIRSFVLVFSTFILMRFYSFDGTIYAIVFTDFISFSIILIITNKIHSFKLGKKNLYLLLSSIFISLIAVILPVNRYLNIIIVSILFYILFDLKEYKKMYSLIISKK